MALRTFDPGLAYDKATGKGIGSTLATVFDAVTGQPIPTFDLDGNEAPVITNRDGYIGQFQADADRVRIQVAGLAMESVNLDAALGLADSAAAAQTAAEAAAADAAASAQAAQDAVAAATGPADDAVSTVVGLSGSKTQVALDGRYSLKSHTQSISSITGLQSVLDAKETPAGAQTKADAALTSAKTYADSKETPSGAQAKADAALASAKTYADGKSKLTYSASDPTDTVGYRPGDLWWKVNSGAGTRIIGLFSVNGAGTAWVGRQIDDGAIYSLDAAKITGTLPLSKMARNELDAAYIARLGTRGSTRTIYVRATGNDTTGDGKTTATAFRQITAAVNSLGADGPVIRGNVVIDVGAGTYKGNIRLPLTRGSAQDDFIKIIGPATGGHPNVPTAIIDYAADNTATWGILAEDGAAIWLEDLKFVGGFPIAVRADRNVYVQWRNVHVDGQGVGSVGFAPNTHVRYYVTGGIIENVTTNGIQELFHVTRAFNTVSSNAAQMIIRNCGQVGLQAKENCVGHLDYLNVEGCPTGIEFQGYCVTNVKSISLKRNTLGIANINSEIHNEDGIKWGTGVDANGRELFTAGSGTELSVWGWVDSSTALTTKAGHRPLVTIAADYTDKTVNGTTAETNFYSLPNAIVPHRYNVAGKRLRVVAWGSVNAIPTTSTGYRILLRFGTTLIGEARIPQSAVVGDDFRVEFDIVCSGDGNNQKVMAAVVGYPNQPTNYATRTYDMAQTASATVNLAAVPGANAESVTMRMIEVWG